MPAQPSQHSILRAFIAKDIARTASIVGTQASPAALANGELVVTDLGLNILDTTTVLTEKKILIVQGRGATEQLHVSLPIAAEDVDAYVGREFLSKVEQVSYIGYNAVTNSGSFSVINDNAYQIRVYLNDQTPSMMHGLYMPIVANYLSDSTATQTEVAVGLYNNLVDSLSRWKQKQILAELVNSSATVTAPAVTATFTPATDVVTFTGASTLAVGDFIRVGTVDTDEVYQVVELLTTPTNAVRINRPFQLSTIVTLTSGNWQRITAADAAAGSFGIRLTGLPRPFVIDSRPYSIVSFQCSLVDMGATPFTTASAAFMGHGTYEQIATIEHASWGAVGQIFNYAEFPPIPRISDSVVGQDYSTLQLNWSKITGETTRTKLAGNISIACPLDGNVANTFDTNITGAVDNSSFVDVLDAWVAANTNFTAQVGEL